MKYTHLTVLVLFVLLFSFCKKEEEQEETKKIPILEIVSPLDGASFMQNDTVNVIAKILAQSTITEVNFYLNGELYITDTESPYQQKIFLQKSENNSISLVAIDNFGNKSKVKDVNISVRALELPHVYFSYNESYYLAEGDSLVFTIFSSSEFVTIEKTALFIDDELFGESSEPKSTFVLRDATVGIYEVYATATDNWGRTSESHKSEITIKEDWPPPVELVEPYASVFNPGSIIDIRAQVDNGSDPLDRIEIYIDNVIIDTLYEWPYETTVSNVDFGDREIYAIAYDINGLSGRSESRFIHIRPGILTNGFISDICASNDKDLVFALNKSTGKLLSINPYTLDYTETSLPYSKPVSMDYSHIDNRLYIVYEFSGGFSEIDISSMSITNFEFSSNNDGRKIEINDGTRRIYIQSNDGFYILNMDNHEVIIENQSINGSIFTLSKPNDFLLTATLASTTNYSYKYTVENDQITLIESKYNIGANTRNIAACPTGDYFVIPCAGGNGTGHTIHAFDMDDINNSLGEFNIDSYPRLARFSYNSNYLYATNGDSYDEHLYVFNANSFQLIQKIELPNSDDCTDIEENINGERILAFTYRDSGNNHQIIYVLER